jgi:uncharacterized protein (TIGR02246 family)
MNYLSTIKPENSSAVELVIDKFEECWNQKDAVNMTALFTQDAEFIDIMGQVALGQDKIKKMHEFVFQKVMKHAIMSHDILYVRDIDFENTLVTIKWTTTGHTDKENKQMPDRKGIMQIILSGTSTDLLIALVQNFDFTTLYNNVDNYNLKFF